MNYRPRSSVTTPITRAGLTATVIHYDNGKQGATYLAANHGNGIDKDKQ